MRFKLALAAGAAVLLLVACQSRPEGETPAGKTGSGQASGQPDPGAWAAAAIWRALILDGGTKGLELLADGDPAALRAVKYRILRRGAGEAEVADFRFRLRASANDPAITQFIGANEAERSARALEAYDALLAGLMRSAAEADTPALYKLAAHNRSLVLRHLRDVVEPVRRSEVHERLTNVREAMRAQKPSGDVP